MANKHMKGCSTSLIIQFGSVDQSCPTICDPMNHSTPGLPVHHQLPEFTQTNVHQSLFLVSCYLSFPFSSAQFILSVIFNSLRPHGLQHARTPCPSQTPGVYSNSCPLSWWCRPTISSSVVPFSSLLQSFPASRSFRIKWPKYWSFSFSISPSNEYSGLISFRMDWLDILAVQGTLKSLFQHHSSKASILQCSAFFIVQLSHPYMTSGKSIALTRWTFDAVFDAPFLPRSTF